jgi:hypothetical protein
LLAGYSAVIPESCRHARALSSCCAKQGLEAQYEAQEVRHQAFLTFELVTVVRITDKELSKIESGTIAGSICRFLKSTLRSELLSSL